MGGKLKGLVGVGAIDCDQEKELCGMFGIKVVFKGGLLLLLMSGVVVVVSF